MIRGGIFVSKEKAQEEIEKGGNVKGIQAKRHRIWIKKWRVTKIKIARLLVELEEVLGKMKEEREDAGVEEIYEALKMWKEVEDEMCVVPGYGFDDRECQVRDAEEDELRSQIGDLVGDMVAVNLHGVIEATKEKDNDNDGYGVGGVIETHSGEEEDNFVTKCQFSRVHPPRRSSKPNKQVPHLARSPGVPRKSKNQPSLPALPTSNSFNSKHVYIPCRLTVAFTDFTTHIPLTQPPTPFHTNHLKLRQLQLHNPYTSAERNHGRLTIQRSSALYTPSTWASPEGCEKVDTSLMNKDWEDVERMWGIETSTQEMETQEGLHIRSWMWVFKWWAKEVRKRGVGCKGMGKGKVGWSV
jgi:hypothetical protein